MDTVNVVDPLVSQRPNDEFIEVTDDALAPKMSEEDFLYAVNFRLPREKSYWDRLQLKLRQDRNGKYWVGEQINKLAIRDDQEKWVENVILRNIETLIVNMTARTPELTATPEYKNQQTRQYSLDVRRSLQAEWEVYQMMQLLLSRAIRNHQINLLGVFKMGYDPIEGRKWTEEIDATNFVISQKGDFVAEYIKDRTLGDLLDTFPDKEKQILKHYGISPISTINKRMRSSPVEYLEIWMNDVVGWKLADFCLGVEPNPHFDEIGEDVPMTDPATGQPVIDPMTGQPQMKKVMYNYFKKPKHPYLFLQYFNRGIHVFDDTTILEQSIGLQDWVNKRKRQIGMNADSTNGHWVSSGDYISQEEFDKIEGGIDEKIWLQNGRPADGLSKVTGQAMPQFVYDDLQDSRQALNTLMGVENATLGAETNNKTLGQDVMQNQQNTSRADGYVRLAVEPLAQKWYEYQYHLDLVYTTEERSVAIPETTDFENENICFSRKRVPLIANASGEMRPVHLLFQVKQGSTLPKNEIIEYKKAMEGKEFYAPLDYLKKIGEPNPRELAKNQLIWQVDPFFFFKDDPQIQEVQQRMAQQAATKNEEAMKADQQSKEQELGGKMKLEQMKQQAKTGKPAENGVSSPGVAKALRSEFDNAGLDAKKFIN